MRVWSTALLFSTTLFVACGGNGAVDDSSADQAQGLSNNSPPPETENLIGLSPVGNASFGPGQVVLVEPMFPDEIVGGFVTLERWDNGDWNAVVAG